MALSYKSGKRGILLKKKLSALLPALSLTTAVAMAFPAPVFAASVQATVPVTEDVQEVDWFHDIPAVYIPGLNNSDTGNYSSESYVRNFYGYVYGIIPDNLVPGATPVDTAGDTTFDLIQTPRPGDIGNQGTHWFIVKEVNDDGTFTVIEQNRKWNDGTATLTYVNRRVSYATESDLRFFRWSDGWELPEDDTLSTDRMLSAGGRTYALFNDVLTWSDAKEKCEALGGHLVTITTAGEQKIVNALTGKGARPAYWIGLTDQANENSFQWVTGESFSYANWKDGAPANDSTRNWVQMAADNKWCVSSQFDAATAIGFLCEWDRPGYLGAPDLLNITKQPEDGIAGEGCPVSIEIGIDSDDVSYRWQTSDDLGDTWINTSQRTSVYTDIMTESTEGRLVRCIVTDQYGSRITSKSARMILSRVRFIEHPASAAGHYGDTVSFTPVVSDDGLTYLWQISDDEGQTWLDTEVTDATYSAVLDEFNNGRAVRCTVTNRYGAQATSHAAFMRLTNLTVTRQPESVTAASGETVTFTVGAEGEDVTYQWQLSDDEGRTWEDTDVTDSTYTDTMRDAIDGCCIRCVITDAYGISVNSDAALMRMARLGITRQPESAAAKDGDTVTFTVGAEGEGVTCRWEISDDAGSSWQPTSVTGDTYTDTLSDQTDGRMVRCVVTDSYGNTVTSDAVSMKLAVLTITEQPVSASGKDGDIVSFTVTAESDGLTDGLTYQWQTSKRLPREQRHQFGHLAGRCPARHSLTPHERIHRQAMQEQFIGLERPRLLTVFCNVIFHNLSI